jgi:hypothetical protein
MCPDDGGNPNRRWTLRRWRPLDTVPECSPNNLRRPREEEPNVWRSSGGARLSGILRLNLLEVLSRRSAEHTLKHQDKRAR